MIVINYQRRDTRGYALFLYDRLSQVFSSQRVFIDVGGQLSGRGDYEKLIFKKIEECRVLLVLIGPDWLHSADENGRRLCQPDDMVRREIDRAFQQDKAVLPVLVNGAPMPRAKQLPDCINLLPRMNAEQLRHERADQDAKTIVDAVKKSLKQPLKNLQPLGTAFESPSVAPNTIETLALAYSGVHAGALAPSQPLNALEMCRGLIGRGAPLNALSTTKKSV
jgi:hypothetical protein